MAETPTKITARIAYWEAQGLPKMRSTESKIYKETAQKLKWTIEGKNMFAGRKYSMLDFRLAVNRHALQALDYNYFPYDKSKLKKLSLSLFLYNRFGEGQYKSAFIRCFNHEPKISSTTKYPALLKMVLDFYLEISGGEIKTPGLLTPKDHANLVKVTNQLGAFYKRHDKIKVSGIYNSPKNLVAAFLQSAKNLTNNNKVRFDTQLLTRGWVWEKFPNYLLQNGYTSPKKQFNIYDY